MGCLDVQVAVVPYKFAPPESKSDYYSVNFTIVTSSVRVAMTKSLWKANGGRLYEKAIWQQQKPSGNIYNLWSKKWVSTDDDESNKSSRTRSSLRSSLAVWPDWAIFYLIGNKSTSKRNLNILFTCWGILNNTTFMQKLFCDILGAILGKLGNFLFHHLVTLFVRIRFKG